MYMELFMSVLVVLVFFFKQKTAYEMRISDWSSDVCSSDLCSTIPEKRSHPARLKQSRGLPPSALPQRRPPDESQPMAPAYGWPAGGKGRCESCCATDRDIGLYSVSSPSGPPVRWAPTACTAASAGGPPVSGSNRPQRG